MSERAFGEELWVALDGVWGYGRMEGYKGGERIRGEKKKGDEQLFK